jgi:hypothetical protein
MRNIDSLSETIGRSLLSNSFEPLFKEYIGFSTDWRYPYAALMLGSQLCGDSIKL